jgi:cytochrome d ubiquinol oxidase subunit I
MYCAVFGTGIRYMLKLVAMGPSTDDKEESARNRGQALRPARPLSAAPDDVNPAIG